VSHVTTYTVPLLNVFRLKCPLCGISLTIPRHSPLGDYDYRGFRDPEFKASGAWPISLLCDHAVKGNWGPQVCECPAPDFQLESIPPAPPPGAASASLWQIDCERACEGCGKPQRIYMWYLTEATPEEITGFLPRIDPKPPCSGNHLLEAGRAVAARIDF
jgi:hypothetical protein